MPHKTFAITERKSKFCTKTETGRMVILPVCRQSMGKTNDHVNVKDIIPKQQTSIEDALNYSKIGNVYGTQKLVFFYCFA